MILAILLRNRYYFICCAIGLIVGAWILFQIERGDGVFYAYSWRHGLLDGFFVYANLLSEPLGYIFALGLLLFVRFRLALLLPVIGIVVGLVVHQAKEYFKEPRPAVVFRYEKRLDQIKPVGNTEFYTGWNSFPSGHTTSAFALYTFLALSLRRKKKVAIILFVMALSGGLARIYLGHHFVKDVYAGAILGTYLGFLIYFLQALIPLRPKDRWVDRRLERTGRRQVQQSN